ncbi:MAG TPA: polymer-forming cytoskeletal protein [Myxococcota bacterium]|nr:polymer-forming cytoskeletal protein [Myxococcota bacterium]
MTLHDPFYDDAHAHPDENAAGGGGSAPEQEFGAAIVRPATGGSDALVPAGGVFEGQVAVVAETRVEGVVRGSLRGPGSLILGEDAHVEGLIDCEGLASRGRIMGPVSVRRRVHLSGTARLEGDVEAQAVRIEDEAVWIGRARIGRPPKP